jgi:hypothetical protein
MTVSTVGKKLTEWAGLLAVIAVVGSLWIDREVERRMNELASDPANAPAVVTLQADMANVKATQARIESKVDTFSTKFLEYLERQAE